MITLKNSEITVIIAERGAEIKSIKKNDREYMWQADPYVWGSTAPVVFPICGGLKDDKFEFGGKTYELEKHGYARFKTFDVIENDDTHAVFSLKSDAESLAKYPFEYDFRITYSICGSTVKVTYSVENKSDKDMYFSVGSHEGYSAPEGIEDYDIIFPERETLDACLVNGNLIGNEKVRVLYDSNVFPLYNKFFTIDCLLFKSVKSKSAVLRNRRTGRSVEVKFPDAKYLVIWTKSCAGYVCIEPWNGIPDSIHASGKLTEKEGIEVAKIGETRVFTHSITVNE